ncbi:TPA: helix-turn-helix transcriptional regulator [Serratia odorifera]|nr:helix-turn-helix transcriptional regulator [Serratia odorifera]
MNVSNAQRKTNIIKNLEYLLRSRGETKASFAHRAGVTRTALYKILEGRVNNVQQSTVSRISDFFGVTCEEIENYDLEQIERINDTISLEGNRNPSAVPVIPQQQFLAAYKQRVGQLATRFPLTYYFGEDSNLVALLVQHPIGNLFSAGDVLIIKRYSSSSENPLILYHSAQQGFFVKEKEDAVFTPHRLKHEEQLIGSIIEERF